LHSPPVSVATCPCGLGQASGDAGAEAGTSGGRIIGSTLMTEDEKAIREVLAAIDRNEPVSIDQLVLELRRGFPEAGLVDNPAKIDRAIVARHLAQLEREERRLVRGEIPVSEIDDYGRPLPNAAERFELTHEGQLELDRLDRLAA
jgi:hypothetical protein